MHSFQHFFSSFSLRLYCTESFVPFCCFCFFFLICLFPWSEGVPGCSILGDDASVESLADGLYGRRIEGWKKKRKKKTAWHREHIGGDAQWRCAGGG
jgi:hypothetical protein